MDRMGRPSALSHDKLARIRSGSTGEQGEDLLLLPVPGPAAVEQQRAQRGQRIACLLRPVAPRPLLPAGYQQIVELLRVPTADGPTGDVALPIVGQKLLSGASIGPVLRKLHSSAK